MSGILYYSNHDEASKKVIQTIVRAGLQAQFHFMCVDNRVSVRNDAHRPNDPSSKPTKTMIVLDNKHQVLMPDAVTHVPALLVLRSNTIVFGDEISRHIRPQQQVHVSHATQRHMEPAAASNQGPSAWDWSGWMGGGVVSDTFSFLDQTTEELSSAHGNAGMRQMHHYAPLTDQFGLLSSQEQMQQQTAGMSQPKLKDGEVSLEMLKQQRDAEIFGGR